jgi:hypothetical protein
MTAPRQAVMRIVVVAAMLTAAACDDSPTAPTATTPLPLQRETASMRYYYEPGDTIDVEWQEIYGAWALGRLGVQPPQQVEYRKYLSRDAMGRHTGNFNTNGYAEPERWRFHAIWPRDNHELVHVYTALIGRPSDFFNEGIAVSFQTDPARGDFAVRFNGEVVHDASRRYLLAGSLPLPLSRAVTTDGFRAIQDSTLSYRMAGSLVLYLTERFGLPAVLNFFRGTSRDESLTTIRNRMQTTFGVSLDDAEQAWLSMLRDTG